MRPLLLRRITTTGTALLLLGVLTACAGTTTAGSSSSQPDAKASSAAAAAGDQPSASPSQARPIAITHIHAVARDPKSGELLLATHEGLLRQSAGGLVQAGPVIDLMSFTVGPDGTFYASGHPGSGTDLPQPAGLITSRDSGRTWQVASRGGESDFHALAVGPTSVTGFDDALRTTTDRTSWTTRTIAAPPRALAASQESGTLLATTSAGLLRSGDGAATWRTLTPPETAVLVAWADERTIMIATTTGRLGTSSDAGATWTLGPRSLGVVEALTARRTTNGQLEAVVVVDGKVLRTTDTGATTKVLVP